MEKTMIRLKKEEIDHIKRSLPYGGRTELAAFLGVSTSSVTNFLKEKSIYDYKEKVFTNVYEMPKATYHKIMAFINLIHDER